MYGNGWHFFLVLLNFETSCYYGYKIINFIGFKTKVFSLQLSVALKIYLLVGFSFKANTGALSSI